MITKIRKTDLLEVLTKNRNEHQEVFEEAWENYKKAVVAELETALADARSGKRIWRSTVLVQPMNQTSEYARAIRMLEMTTEDTIELDEDQFSQLVLNKWHWARQFSASNRAYATSEKSMSYFNSIGDSDGSL